MADQPKGCARTTGSVVGGKPPETPVTESTQYKKEMTMTAQVGRKAPDFEAPAYYKGEFTTVKLSNYLGKWV